MEEQQCKRGWLDVIYAAGMRHSSTNTTKWTRLKKKSCNYISPREQYKQPFAASLHLHIPVRTHICTRMLAKVFFFLPHLATSKNFTHLHFFAVLALCIFKEGGPAGLHPASLRWVGEKGGRVTLPPLSLLLKSRLKRPANQRGGWREGRRGLSGGKSRGERGEDVPLGEKGVDGWWERLLPLCQFGKTADVHLRLLFFCPSVKDR